MYYWMVIDPKDPPERELARRPGLRRSAPGSATRVDVAGRVPFETGNPAPLSKALTYAPET
jgi:hypothetical protein